MQHDTMCSCDVCMPPLPEDTLWLIPERERWESELWVWTDEDSFYENGVWMIAPRVKVWRLGERNKQLPILRTGSRTSRADFDVPFVSVHDRKIAAFAADRAGLALPCQVELVRYSGFDHRKMYVTTITVGEDIN